MCNVPNTVPGQLSENSGQTGEGARSEQTPPAKSLASEAVMSPDPRPLASYRLGYYTREVWLSLRVFWEWPYEERDAWPGVVERFKLLEEAKTTLAGAMEPAKAEDLGRAIRSLKKLAWKLHDAWETESTGWHGGRWFGSGPVPEGSGWAVLKLEADQVRLQPAHLNRWYEIGKALGTYEVLVNAEQDEDSIPEAQGLFALIASLPGDQLSLVPELKGLAEHAEESTESGPGALLMKALTSAGNKLRPEEFGLGTTRLSMERLVRALSRCVEFRLENATWLTPVSAESESRIDDKQSQKPSWSRHEYKLRLGETTIRKVKRQADSNIVKVLDAFEEQGWPGHIDDPVQHDLYPLRIHETIRSLNTRLRLIRFHADGEGKGICWERLDPPDNSQTTSP
jgi:hypothetical protein